MKGHNENHHKNTNQSIPSELMEQIISLQKQNANSTFELLKTQRKIQDFQNKLKELELKIDQLNPQNSGTKVEDGTLLKLRELQRFLD